jgi:hypothetical protein
VSNIVGVLVTLLIIFLRIQRHATAYVLPELLLQEQKHPYHALKEKEKERKKNDVAVATKRGHRKSKLAPHK